MAHPAIPGSWVRVETLLLRANLWRSESYPWGYWLDPARMVPLRQATIPPGHRVWGKWACVVPGAVSLEVGGKMLLDHANNDGNAYGWWNEFTDALGALAADPRAEFQFDGFHRGTEVGGAPLRLQRRREWVACSLDYRSSRTGEHERASARAPFDEFLRKSLDEAERFYTWLVERDPDNAGEYLEARRAGAYELRRRYGVVPWPTEGEEAG